jgi:phosphonate degradation associated HDIG domain protein
MWMRPKKNVLRYLSKINNGLMKSEIENIVEEVFSLYERFGAADYIGEPVSQLEHMSQSAQLAITEGYADEVVLAAFFHDIGHICVMQLEAQSMGGYGVKSHEKIGADYLRNKGFPESIARLVENHVQAKRYLTYQFPEYYNNLSEASKQTLIHQGGRMHSTEAEDFEKDPLFDISIRMRTWDEMAKETGLDIVDIELLKDKVRKILATNTHK